MMTLLAIDTAVDVPPWGVQLGLAFPLALAVLYLGRYLLRRLEKSEARYEALSDKMMDQVLPAIRSTSDLGQQILAQREDVKTLREDVHQDVSMLREDLKDFMRESRGRGNGTT